MPAPPVILDASGRPIPQAVIRRARAQAALGAYLAGSGSAPELRDWTPPAGSPDADLDGDRLADVVVLLEGVQAISEKDFIL